jgi:hypothetical protein
MGGARHRVFGYAQAWCKEAQLIVSGSAEHLGAICTAAAAGLHQHQSRALLVLQGSRVDPQVRQIHRGVQQRHAVAEG